MKRVHAIQIILIVIAGGLVVIPVGLLYIQSQDTQPLLRQIIRHQSCDKRQVIFVKHPARLLIKPTLCRRHHASHKTSSPPKHSVAPPSSLRPQGHASVAPTPLPATPSGVPAGATSSSPPSPPPAPPSGGSGDGGGNGGGGTRPPPPPNPPPATPPPTGVNICVTNPLAPVCVHAPALTGPGGVLPHL